jgi:hypothetical protein
MRTLPDTLDKICAQVLYRRNRRKSAMLFRRIGVLLVSGFEYVRIAAINTTVIECPKCATPSRDGAIECPRCGIVFAKFEDRRAAPDATVVPPIADKPRQIVSDPRQRLTRLARAALLVGLLVWTWQFARAGVSLGSDSILHLPNLIFHEAGHVLFGVFGRFLTVLGGSLFQFALPLALAGVFLKQHDQFGAAVCTWWAGQNLVDLGPYIADARALRLVLLGGKTGAEVEGHDWEYLLTELGWLHLDRTLGLGAHRIGVVIMAGALIWGAICLTRDREHAAAARAV